MANRNFDTFATEAKTWATGHLVAAGAICLAVGVLLGALFF